MNIFEKIKSWFKPRIAEPWDEIDYESDVESRITVNHTFKAKVIPHPYMSKEAIEEEAKRQIGKAFADFVFDSGLINITHILDCRDKKYVIDRGVDYVNFDFTQPSEINYEYTIMMPSVAQETYYKKAKEEDDDVWFTRVCEESEANCCGLRE